MDEEIGLFGALSELLLLLLLLKFDVASVLLGTTSILFKGEKLGNMPSVYWSLNYWPVEADR